MSKSISRHVRKTWFLGILTSDPPVTSLEPGNFWFNKTDGYFKFYDGDNVTLHGGTYTKEFSIQAEQLGRPNTNPPTVVDQDNLTLYSFTVGTDRMTLKLQIPTDYDSGPISFAVVWTNDGGVDDFARYVKWQLDFQVASEGDVISGNDAHSPLTVDDMYESALGWVEHKSSFMDIPAAAFADKECIFIKLSAVTALLPALTCEPHLIGVCQKYVAKRYVL